ncbi:hypothetical protein BDM02DRAFT_1055675 [Thelephora ganbajun]|uniref:Uncharacterized protein n=1 Tax=Thelephora ganbajun TaxID=370292 RepID=A0ACB6Z4Y8_THEGA|nr:hypothetical protein BDM02DRAFT_1055675 [Thelephora ganbajun]
MTEDDQETKYLFTWINGHTIYRTNRMCLVWEWATRNRHASLVCILGGPAITDSTLVSPDLSIHWLPPPCTRAIPATTHHLSPAVQLRPLLQAPDRFSPLQINENGVSWEERRRCPAADRGPLSANVLPPGIISLRVPGTGCGALPSTLRAGSGPSPTPTNEPFPTTDPYASRSRGINVLRGHSTDS